MKIFFFSYVHEIGALESINAYHNKNRPNVYPYTALCWPDMQLQKCQNRSIFTVWQISVGLVNYWW